MYKMRYGLFEGLFYKEMHRLKKKKKKSIGKTCQLRRNSNTCTDSANSKLSTAKLQFAIS